MQRLTIRYLMIAMAWIAVSLALLQITVIPPSVGAPIKVGILGDSAFEIGICAALPIRGFALLSIFSVPAHLVATSLALKGLWKWVFGIVAPTLVLVFWLYYSVTYLGYFRGPLWFWGHFQIVVINNSVGFLMVNTLYSLPAFLYSLPALLKALVANWDANVDGESRK